MRTSLAVLVSCALPLGACAEYRAAGYVGYIQPRLTGDLGLAASGGGGITGTVQFDDLGVDREGSPYARLELGTPIVSLTASAFTYDSAGDSTLQADFGDISAGVPVHTETDFTQVKAALTHDFQIGPVRLSPGIAVDYFDIDMRVSAIGFVAVEDVAVQAPVPMLFAQGALDLGPVAATVDVGGISAHIDEVDGDFFDVEAMLRLSPIGPVELFAGYRWIRVDAVGTADGQDFDADMTLAGWMVGGGVSF